MNCQRKNADGEAERQATPAQKVAAIILFLALLVMTIVGAVKVLKALLPGGNPENLDPGLIILAIVAGTCTAFHLLTRR